MGTLYYKESVQEASSKAFQVYIFLCISSKYSVISLALKIQTKVVNKGYNN